MRLDGGLTGMVPLYGVLEFMVIALPTLLIFGVVYFLYWLYKQ